LQWYPGSKATAYPCNMSDARYQHEHGLIRDRHSPPRPHITLRRGQPAFETQPMRRRYGTAVVASNKTMP
jgi:hypothetical protein